MSCPKTVLVIGGTGRLGTAIVQSILDKDSNVKIKIFARHKDEEFLKQQYVRKALRPILDPFFAVTAVHLL